MNAWMIWRELRVEVIWDAECKWGVRNSSIHSLVVVVYIVVYAYIYLYNWHLSLKHDILLWWTGSDKEKTKKLRDGKQGRFLDPTGRRLPEVSSAKNSNSMMTSSSVNLSPACVDTLKIIVNVMVQIVMPAIATQTKVAGSSSSMMDDRDKSDKSRNDFVRWSCEFSFNLIFLLCLYVEMKMWEVRKILYNSFYLLIIFPIIDSTRWCYEGGRLEEAFFLKFTIRIHSRFQQTSRHNDQSQPLLSGRTTWTSGCRTDGTIWKFD